MTSFHKTLRLYQVILFLLHAPLRISEVKKGNDSFVYQDLCLRPRTSLSIERTRPRCFPMSIPTIMGENVYIRDFIDLDATMSYLEWFVKYSANKPPEGYFPSDNKVCRLKKSLYGLKQAPRQWNAKLTSTLIENGFSQSKSDYSLYTKSDKVVFLALLGYVDDIIITDTNKGIYLNKRKYVLDLLSKCGILACKPAKTPLMSKLVISNEASKNDPLLENIIDYQKLMGKLIYLTNTRPDISYVVHCLSQFMHSPLSSHLKTAFKILRYLKSYPVLGIHIARTSGMFLNAYSDADWANNKQNTLSKSSTEAEYRGLASVTSEVIWILKILKDFQIEKLLPLFLHCDYNSTIKIAANLIFTERTKHLEIDLHFVKEKILEGVVKTVKVDSANQIADILTKGLDTVQHLELVKRLGMIDVYQVETKGGS
ncbi:ribonuclease H-like domain-containing protein [Tanacetum coccineum]